jgi:chemotaxis protein MotB
MSKHDERPIIIKRGPPAKKGHHGGAWKLAYADFMTAMMAFFLLMWLLGSANTAELSGIADYFKMPLKTALLGGTRTSEGASILQGGGIDMTHADGQVHRSNGRDRSRDMFTSPNSTKQDEARITPASEKAEMARLHELQIRLEQALAANPALRPFRQQILIEVMRDGLRIQIIDTQNRPMFANASADVEPYMRTILREIGKALNDVPNSIVLSGHTDARPYAGGEQGYSNWELSADRANASRRELVAGGMDEQKVLRVIGLASAQNLDKDDPLDPANRRISIIVLNRRTEAAYQTDDQKAFDVPNEQGAGAALLKTVAAPLPK